MTTMTVPDVVQQSVEKWRVFLESDHEVPEGLFAPDMFSDLTFPLQRQQFESADSLVHVRRASTLSRAPSAWSRSGATPRATP